MRPGIASARKSRPATPLRHDQGCVGRADAEGWDSRIMER